MTAEHADHLSDEDWLTQRGFDPDVASDLIACVKAIQALGGPTLIFQPRTGGGWYLNRPLGPGDPSPELVTEDGFVPVTQGTDQKVAGFVTGVFWVLDQQATAQASSN